VRTSAARLIYRAGPPGLLRSSDAPPLFCATSDAVDAHGEIVRPEGISWGRWVANPVIQRQHNSQVWPVARGGTPQRWQRDDINGWAVELFWPARGVSAEADTARGLVESGALNALSIGFRPRDSRPATKEEKARGVTGVVHTRSEVFEISLVNVPSNPQSVRLREFPGLRHAVGSPDEVEIEELRERIREKTRAWLQSREGWSRE
jgi:hypothetical protein